jgi:uncharacterized protein
MIGLVPPPPLDRTPSRTGLVVRMAIYILVAWLGLIVLSVVLFSIVDTLLSGVVTVVGAAAIANFLTVRIFERGRAADLGLAVSRASLRHVSLGFAIATLAGVLVVALPVLLGGAFWQPAAGPVASRAGLYYTLALLALGVTGEELLFRGYGFQVAASVLGRYAALLPMGVLFALAHSGNLNISRLGLFNTFAWGVLLGWTVLRSGDLWLATGLHLGWNWVLPLLGVNLSGLTIRVTPYELRWRWPDLWTGGAYGPEGGLLCTLVVGIVMAMVWHAPLLPGRLPLLREPSPAPGASSAEGGPTS